MTSPSEKLAQSMEELRLLQEQGKVAIRSSDLSRVHRERLVKNGFLQEVLKAWFVVASPSDLRGESTAWYTSFWGFCVAFLNDRFMNKWCLSPEQSLSLHVGNWTVPQQLLIRTPKGNNKITQLLYETSIFDVRYKMPVLKNIEIKQGMRVYTLVAALIDCSAQFFKNNPTDARAAISMIRDASEILPDLLEGGHSTIAGRLAGAFRNIHHDRIADDILKAMQAAGFVVRELDPFINAPKIFFAKRERSPYVNRIHVMWHEMRENVIKHFPKARGLPKDTKKYLAHVEEIYVTDAYHSLSIEGYKVTPALIEKVRKKQWDPDKNVIDKADKNALAARGYWQAFQSVKKSVAKILRGATAGDVVAKAHSDWYLELFGPSVAAGLLKPMDLAGYRNGAVYIRNSKHVPPSYEAVRDLMPAFFDLLAKENNPAVRVVLGHFLFVYIHPYYDGNGRMGRFLMNTMLAAGGYAWTVIPLEQRAAYMSALEKASVQQDIIPFSRFLGSLIDKSVVGKRHLKRNISS